MSWDGGGGDSLWSNPDNWSTDTVPGDADDVVIPSTPHTQIIFDGPSSTIRTLTLSDSLKLSSGTLTVSEGMDTERGVTISAEGATAKLLANSVSSIDGIRLSVEQGAYISLGGAEEFTNTVGDTTWRVEGVGSVLSLPDLLRINNSPNHEFDIYLQAFQGGELDLSSVVEIIDPNAGEQRGRSIQVHANGAGSTIKLHSLKTFLDHNANTTSTDQWAAQYSQLDPVQDGVIELGALETVRGVFMTDASLDTSTIRNANYTRVDIGNELWAFDSLETLTNSDLNIYGADQSFPSLTNIDGTQLDIQSASQVVLSGITGVTNTVGDTTWRVEGVGSVLSLPDLLRINNSPNHEYDIYLQAFQGGELDLSSVVEIIDPNAGEQRGRSIQVHANGAGSTIKLHSLKTFLDHNANTTSNDQWAAQYSRIEALQGSEIVLGKELYTRGVYTSFDSVSNLLFGVLTIGSSSLLTGSGTLHGSVDNQSQVMVDPEGIELRGDFTQTPTGTTTFTISGAIDQSQYSRLRVSGVANLSGNAQINRVGNFEPDTFSVFDIVSASAFAGQFDEIAGADTSDPELEAIYGQSNVVIARQFDRQPFQTFTYENRVEGNRVFFNVLDTDQSRIEYRLVQPNGDLVFASNSTVSSPDLGDFGPFTLDLNQATV